jgi:phosphoribosyl-ATP pyrophosphohydrolase
MKTINDMLDIAALSLAKHGASNQELKLYEEMAELTVALRHGHERELIRGECVDVIIMSMQMLLNASDDYSDVEKIMSSKFTSLLLRLRK